jgi:hypothetical protein
MIFFHRQILMLSKTQLLESFTMGDILMFTPLFINVITFELDFIIIQQSAFLYTFPIAKY